MYLTKYCPCQRTVHDVTQQLDLCVGNGVKAENESHVYYCSFISIVLLLYHCIFCI